MARLGEPQLPAVPMWYWEAIAFLLSSLFSQLHQSLLRGEKGGRAPHPKANPGKETAYTFGKGK